MGTNFRLDWSWGDVSLDLANRDGGGAEYALEVLADGYDPGSVEAVREVTSALFLDGEHAIQTRDGNVVKAFNVRVRAADSVGLQAGEAALDLMRGRRASQISWSPHDGFGATSVRKVLVANITQVFNDLDEVLRGWRVFRVTLECLPHVYSDTPVSFTLGTGVSTVDATTSMAAWTVESGSASVVGGHVTTGSGVATVLSITPPVDLEEYLYLEVTSAAAFPVTAVTVGGETIPLANIKLVSDTSKTYTIPVARWRGSRPKITLSFTNSGTGHALQRFETQPFADRTLTVVDAEGTRRSPATVRLYRSAGPLGDVFLYTAPDPNELLRDGVPFSVLGTVTVTESAPNVGRGGFVTVAGTPKRFAAGTKRETLGETKPQAAFTGRQLWPPTVAVSTTGNLNTVTVGTTYVFPTDRDAKVSLIAGVAKKGIWFIPKTPDFPSGGVFVGDQEDGSDAVPLTLAEGDLFDPPAVFPDRTGIIAKAANAGAVATVTYTPAWAYNAGR